MRRMQMRHDAIAAAGGAVALLLALDVLLAGRMIETGLVAGLLRDRYGGDEERLALGALLVQLLLDGMPDGFGLLFLARLRGGDEGALFFCVLICFS